MYYQVTVPQFIKTLQNLNKILDKAAGFADSKKIEFDVLLNARLYPDMLPLTRQIQIISDTAKMGVARLTGKEAPPYEDNEKTLADVRTRIDKTISFLRTITESDFRDSATRKCTTPRWEGKWLTGEEFLAQSLLPNFYFHVTTAYAILRHSGVEIGKNDYLGELPKKNP